MARHVIVDGSNIATEGRSQPSLKQLNEAVMAFMAENPKDKITVVVDATFGHRIDRKEVAEFDEAIANNELVAPPAGTVGRGDAFVLMIAQKVGASILSNDSYQEFHGDYRWLFDEGRLIGGKPVPNVGWVFVPRTPVRGEKSRRATSGKKAQKSPKVTAAAMKPMPVPKAPPPGAVLPKKKPAPEHKQTTPRAVNGVLPFLHFLEKHPIGSVVKGVVESYSSHGAYVQMGDVNGYVPLRLMGDPMPRSARDVMKIGDEVTLEVVSVVATRRSIDLKPTTRRVSVKATDDVKVTTAKKQDAPKKDVAKKDVAKKVAAKKATAKKAAPKKSTATTSAVAKSPAKKAVVKKATVKKAAPKKAAPKKDVVKKAAAKKAVPKKSTTK
jgi:predicted RNA-binding protein with RPS1 domain